MPIAEKKTIVADGGITQVASGTPTKAVANPAASPATGASKQPLSPTKAGSVKAPLSPTKKPAQLKVSGDISLSDAALDTDEAVSPSKRYNLRSAGSGTIRAILGHPVNLVSGDVSLSDASLSAGSSSALPTTAGVSASLTSLAKKAKQAVGLEDTATTTATTTTTTTKPVSQKATEGAQAIKGKTLEAVNTAKAAAGVAGDKTQKNVVSPTRTSVKRGAETLTGNLATLEGQAAEGLEYAKHVAADGLDYAKHRLEDGVKYAKQKTGFGAGEVKERTSESSVKVDTAKKNVAEKATDVKKAAEGKAAELKTAAASTADQAKAKINNAQAKPAAHDPHNPVAEYLAAPAKSPTRRSASRSPTRAGGVTIPSVAGAPIGANMPDEEVMTL